MDGPQETARRLGALVVAHRRRARLRQDELAALAGIDRQYLGELERGKLTQHLGRLVGVLDALGLELTAIPRTTTLGVEGAPEQSADA